MAVLVAGGPVAGSSDLGSWGLDLACSCCWARTWLEREVVLERQHERLKALLVDLQRSHAVAALAGPVPDGWVSGLTWLAGLHASFSAHRIGPQS